MSVVRIRRRGGEIVQDCEVYIGRACYMGGWSLPQSKWHNPFSAKIYSREESLAKYREHITSNAELMSQIGELKGKVLGCWCKPKTCHGDVLLELCSEYS